MTISIEHAMPLEIELADQTIFGRYRPGNVVTPYETGNVRSRSYFEHNLQKYIFRFTPSRYTDDEMEQLAALLERVAVNAEPFWIKEPIERAHSGAVSEITVTGETSYVLPIDITPRITLGTLPDYGARTIHSAANLMTDAQANGDGGVTTGLAAFGSCAISSVPWPALAGRSSILVDPTGSVGNVGVVASGSGATAISGSQRYTVGASFLVTDAAYSYTIRGQFYDGATPGSVFSDSDTGVVGEWLHLRASAVSAASDDSLNVRAERTTTSGVNFHIGCLMVAPGDFERWFMPSTSPRVVEWDSAPTGDLRIVCSSPTSVQRWTRVRMEANNHSAAMELLGDSSIEAMRVKEVLFRMGQ